MKIAIIGGASARTPLLVNALAHSDLQVDEVGLFDSDGDRLNLIGSLAREFAECARTYDDARACIANATFVILSIRAGGIEARARDEAIAIEHGIVGQETVGPAGFAMAIRNIPPAVEYARIAGDVAPRAWIVNFTNPVGIVTQAMTAAGARVIGICDTPTELFEDVAHVLGLESSRCYFDYFGLNHLGWLREVYYDGTPQVSRLWTDPGLLDRIYRRPLFDPPFLRTLRLLPSEYLFYYYRSDAARDNTRAAGQTRGQAIAALNEQLFRDLASGHGDRRRVYEEYLQARNAGYMQIESGPSVSTVRRAWAEVTGYDKIAVQVIGAIYRESNAILPLNVANGGALPDLAADDVVEVPCVVNGNGARPLAVGAVPDGACDLLVRVKEYERLTLAAASERSIDAAVRALARNPLVADDTLARRLVDALQLW